MPVPTLAAVRKHPMAVIVHTRDVATRDKVEKDFEWFDTDEGRTEYVTKIADWAAKSVVGDPTWEILLVSLKDTETLELDSVVAYGRDTDQAKEWADGVIADVETIFKKAPRKDAQDLKNDAYKVEAEIPEAPKPRVVKARRKSGAAAAIEAEVEEPVAKPKAKNLKAALRAKGEAMMAQAEVEPDVEAAEADMDEQLEAVVPAKDRAKLRKVLLATADKMMAEVEPDVDEDDK